MPIDQAEVQSRVLVRLNDLCEEDFKQPLDADEFCREFSLSRQEFRSLLTPLYSKAWVETEFEKPTGGFTIRLTPSGKEAYDTANGIAANEKVRNELLDFLAEEYEKNEHATTDSDLIAKQLGLHWNKVCFNLAIMETHGLVRLDEQYGVGHTFYLVTLAPEGKYAHDNPEPKMVFLSHAAADQEIAMHLKEVIETCFPQVRVFVSSDPEDLPPGNPWVHTVLENLKSAKMLLILATERGLSRKWVWFETGAGWSRDLLFIPCCTGKVRKGQLPHPYSGYQALNIDEEGDFNNLVDVLGKQFGGLQKVPESRTVTAELTRLDSRAEESQSIPREAFDAAGREKAIRSKSAKEALRDRMLLLVAAHEDTGSAAYLSDKVFADELNTELREIQKQLLILENNGLLKGNKAMGLSYGVRLTPAGLAKVEELQREAESED